MTDEATVPAFARGVKFRHDAVRGQWVILAPERAYVPDATAVEILKLVDGTLPLAVIIDRLAGLFTAPRDLITADVLHLIDDLSAQGLLRLRPG